MSDTIDCEYTDNLICPYCGAINSAPYEVFRSSDEDASPYCGSCGLEYDAVRHVSVRYTSSPKVQQAPAPLSPEGKEAD